MLATCSVSLHSPLEIHARKIRDGFVQEQSGEWQLFSMYVIPVEDLLQMTQLIPHETLLDKGKLVEHLVRACADHPDRSFEQFAVLQGALKNLMAGDANISGNISIELYRGWQNEISASDIFSKQLFIWYDYFSCPQLDHGASVHNRKLAIASIPAFVDKSQYFIILCPHVRRTADNQLLTKKTWGSRAWCRLEKMARELSTHADTCISIEIHGPLHQVEAPAYGWMQAPVGTGNFSVESDRWLVAKVLQEMTRKKMHFYLARGDLLNFRLLMNLQRVHLRNLPVQPIDAVVPGFISNSQDPATYLLGSFMYQNGFQSTQDRTSDGWSPMCFAALDGRPLLLAALLEERADVNDRITEQSSTTFGSCPLLHICSFLSHNDAIQVLISNRADVLARDGYGASALPWAAFSDNVEGIRVLIAAGCDPTQADMLGYYPFTLASSAGSVASMKELLPYTPRPEITKSLNVAMLQGGGSAEVVSMLIGMEADVNHQSSLPTFSVLGIMFGCLSLRHRFRESKLSTYAYHHDGLTPLMCSVITSSFEATAVLLGVGARTDLRNSREKTALDLALETYAPEYIVSALQDSGNSRKNLVLDVAEYVENHQMVSESF